MTTRQSAQQARNTKIFVIDNVMTTGGWELRVTETSLYDHVRESAEETTSPRGIIPKLFIEHNEEESTWELRHWEANGRSRVIDSYSTEEEAEDEWYTRTYNCDFLPDDQRDTMYWASREEAEAELKERIANQ